MVFWASQLFPLPQMPSVTGLLMELNTPAIKTPRWLIWHNPLFQAACRAKVENYIFKVYFAPASARNGYYILSPHESKHYALVHLKELGCYEEHLEHLCCNPGLSTKRDLQKFQGDCRKYVFLDISMKLSLLRLTHYCFKRSSSLKRHFNVPVPFLSHCIADCVVQSTKFSRNLRHYSLKKIQL